ncbi:MAG: cysteine--tRNA ligase [Candidatus Omnitrophica bacterium]|nr:cysteine--tRNA ligase [Candidatus Omnitrophota bacterium]
MRLHNTLTRKVEAFAPMDGRTVRMYVCGPTVYDEPHIGHARSAYIFDVLRRYFQYKGFTVNFVRNVTDVDDKIIHKARETGESPEAVAKRCLARYHETMDRLGIGRPTREPLATGHIDEMINCISQLVVNGSAYETKTGDVYFAVRKFPGYGKLSNRSIDELQAGARVEPGEHPVHSEALGGAGKQDPLDFALWKAAKPDEPAWKSPWGKGRPGWHIECSAMSTKYLGDEFDIHGGGVDLVFPHHENEIAQAQAAGKKFARCWIHNGLLTVNGEKMSKSLGNFITVDKALEECENDPDHLKLFFLLSHYRSPVDYNPFALKTASGMMRRIDFFLLHAAETPTLSEQEIARNLLRDHKEQIDKEIQNFNKAMDSDLNTPMALAAIFEIIGYTNQVTISLPKAENQAALFRYSAERIKQLVQQVFGMSGNIKLGLEDKIKREVDVLVQKREGARRGGDYKKADQIRNELLSRGIVIEDTPRGPKLRKQQSIASDTTIEQP